VEWVAAQMTGLSYPFNFPKPLLEDNILLNPRASCDRLCIFLRDNIHLMNNIPSREWARNLMLSLSHVRFIANLLGLGFLHLVDYVMNAFVLPFSGLDGKHGYTSVWMVDW
jgi:hypothetical protein